VLNSKWKTLCSALSSISVNSFNTTKKLMFNSEKYMLCRTNRTVDRS